MEIGIQALGVIDLEPRGRELGFKAVAEAGFEGVDFSFEAFYDTRSIADKSIPCFYDRTLDELKKFFEPYAEECAKYGLKLLQSHAPFNKYIEDKTAWGHFVEIERRSIELAGFIGSPYIVIHPIIAPGRTGEEELQINRDFYRRLIPFAKAAGVKLCLENLFDYTDESSRGAKDCIFSEPKDAVAFLEEMNGAAGDDVFKFCLDIGHAALLKRDIREMINTVAQYLVITHLHDNNGENDLHALPLTHISSWGGSNIVNWTGFIEGMRDIDYQGTLSFETAGVMLGLPEQLKPAAMKYTASVGKYLRDRINT